HKEQGCLGREQQQGSSHHAGPCGYESSQPLAVGAVANLVVVLNANYMCWCGHLRAARSSRTSLPEAERLSLKNKAFIQRPDNLLRPAEILVIAFAFAGEKRVNCMMKIITPDSIQAIASVAGAHQFFVILVSL